MNSFRAAVCYGEFPSKLKFQNSSKSVRKNPLVRHFGKSQSKFPKSFQSPWEKKRFKETSSSLEGNNRHPGQAILWLKILQDDAFCTRLKKARRFLSLALS